MARLRGGNAITPDPPPARRARAGGLPVGRRAFSAPLLVACILAVLLAGCAGATPPPTVPPPAASATTASRGATATAAPAASVGPSAAPNPSGLVRPTIPALPSSAPAASAKPTPTPLGLNGVAFGMTQHFMWYDLGRATAELDTMRAAGLTVARFDVAWRWVEPQRKGQYDVATLTRLDALLAAMDARGIAPIITVIETPAWARPEGSAIFTPPTDHADYADFVGVLAARYADRPQMVWEVWNEPNLVEFWTTGPNPAEYADLLKRAYRAIKAADPDATVLGGSIVFNDLKFLRGMYQNGARGAFDGLALHPYAPGRSPDDRRDPSAMFLAVEDMKAVMDANGDRDRPIWITEMGWGLDLVTDSARATYLKRAVALVKGWPYVRVFCVYTLNQDVGPDAQSFGLLEPGGQASASWSAYIDATRGR